VLTLTPERCVDVTCIRQPLDVHQDAKTKHMHLFSSCNFGGDPASTVLRRCPSRRCATCSAICSGKLQADDFNSPASCGAISADRASKHPHPARAVPGALAAAGRCGVGSDAGGGTGRRAGRHASDVVRRRPAAGPPRFKLIDTPAGETPAGMVLVNIQFPNAPQSMHMQS